jgi:hypothetical protein
MNRPASILSRLSRKNKQEPKHLLASLGLRKRFCEILIKQVLVISLECSSQTPDNAHWTPGNAAQTLRRRIIFYLEAQCL